MKSKIEFETANGCSLPDEIKYHNPEVVSAKDKLTIEIPHVISSKYFNIGLELKRCRKHRNYTLRDVESITGISNELLSQIETGHVKSPGFMKIIRLIQFYKVELIIKQVSPSLPLIEKK